MPLEEFLTKARTRTEDSGRDPTFKDETLRDTLIFGLKSDKVRKDAISKGNSLTFQQVYDLAKTEESTRAQMQVTRQGDLTSESHFVRSKKKGVALEGSGQAGNSKAEATQKTTLRTTAHLSANQSSNLKSMVASDVETNTTAALHAQPHMPSTHTARKQGTSRKYA